MSTGVAAEVRGVVIGLGVVSSLAVVQVAIGAGDRLLGSQPPSARAVAAGCFVTDKRLAVELEPRDPIASTAGGGLLSTVVEGNPLTLAFADSDREAASIARLYVRVAGSLGSRLEIRGHVVHVWSGIPTPTQRQTVYDCAG